jgi:Domain of unknown function (DUF4926)
MNFQEHDTVVLLKDLITTRFQSSEQILVRRGSLGVIVAPIFAESHALVEFADRKGAPYAMPEVALTDLRLVVEEPPAIVA